MYRFQVWRLAARRRSPEEDVANTRGENVDDRETERWETWERIREQEGHVTALLVEFKHGADNDYETGANMKMATAPLAHKTVSTSRTARTRPRVTAITTTRGRSHALQRRDLNALTMLLGRPYFAYFYGTRHFSGR